MPVTLNSTGISFSDGNSQNTEAAAVNIGSTTVARNPGTVPGGNLGYFVTLVGGGGGGSSGPGGQPGGGGGTGGGFISINDSANLPFNVGGGGSGGTWNGGRVGSAGGASNAGGLTANGGNGGGPAPNGGSAGNTGGFSTSGNAFAIGALPGSHPSYGNGGPGNNQIGNNPGAPGNPGSAGAVIYGKI